PAKNFFSVSIRRKNRIPEVLHAAVANHDRQASQQCLAGSLKDRQTPGPRQLQFRVRKNRKRQMESLDELLLIGGVLRGEPEHFCTRGLHLGVMVAKSTRLRSASASTRDEIPVVDEWRLAWPAGARVCINDNPASIDGCQGDLSAVCRRKRHGRHARVSKVIRGAVVDWRR